jgi:hypothetical protein
MTADVKLRNLSITVNIKQ